MAKTTVAIDLQAQTKGTESVKSLKQQIREATQEAILLAQKFGEFSPEATSATKKVAQLKDQMGDFQERVAGLNPDKFQAIATVTGGLAKGIQAAQGAMSLFGTESEDVQKALLKVQAATAFSEGLQGILNMRNSFGALATDATKAFTSIKTAIMTSGVGAITVLIGAIAIAITALTQKKQKVKELSQEQKSLNNINDEYRKIIEESYAKSLAQISILKDTNMSIKDRKTALISLQEQYPGYLNNINLETISSKELKLQTDKLTESIYRRAKAEAAMSELTKIAGKELRLELSLIGKATDDNIKERRKALANQGLTPAQIEKQLKLAGQVSNALDIKTKKELEDVRKAKDGILSFLKETNAVSETIVKSSVDNSKNQTKDLTQEALERQAILLSIDQDTYEKQINAADAQFATTIKQLKEQGFSQEEINILRDANLEKIRKDFFQKKADDEQKAIDNAKKQQEEERRRLEEQAAYREKLQQQMLASIALFYSSEKTKAIERNATQNEINAIEIQQLQDSVNATKAIYQSGSKEIIDAELALAAKKKEIRDKDAEDQKRAEEQRYALAAQGFAAIADLADAFAGKSEEQQKKAFELRKKAAIAQAIVETISSAQSAYASQLSIPTPDAPIRAAVAAALAIAAGVARVQKIGATKFESKSVSGGGGGNAPNAPNTTPLTGGLIPDMEQPGGFAGMGRVYVLEGDITKTQTRVRRVRNVSVV